MPESPTARELLARYHRAMLDWSADDLADLYAPDALHELPFAAAGGPTVHRGREAVRAAYKAAWEASPVRVRSIDDVRVHETVDPEVIVAEQRLSAIVTGTGREFTAPCVLVIRVRDGRIVHVRDYPDALAVATALGVRRS